MLPTLAPGDHLLVDERAYASELPSPGDVVLARPPALRGEVVVKRVGAVEGGRVFLECDNPSEGTGSAHFGSLERADLLGRVTARVG